MVHAPKAEGIGTGKAFFFLFGYKRASELDQQMLAKELEQIDDDIDVLRSAGYTVIVDPQGTRPEFLATVTGAAAGAEGLVPAGFYWSAHGGADGSLECCNGAVVKPAHLDPSQVAPGLRLAILGACYVGAHSRTWRRALGGRALVVGWGRPVTIDRAVEFLQPDSGRTTDLSDLIQRWLLTDEPLPVDPEPVALPDAAAALGRIGELAGRVPTVAGMLGAQYQPRETCLVLDVPLPDGRTQLVELFLLDGVEEYAEGRVLVGMEAEVGEITALVTPELLLAGAARPGYGRVALVSSDTDMPRIITQSFVAFAGLTDQDLAAHLYQVAAKADALENTLFGMDEA